MKDFEQRLERLEEISDQLRDGDIPLSNATSFFEEGIKLARSLEKDLSRIERKIEILLNEPENPEDSVELELFPELNEEKAEKENE